MNGKRRSRNDDGDDRGQMYTLEGFAAAAVVLFALLFAMQSVVIAPGTGGAVDRTAQAQQQQQLQDGLVVSAHAEEGNLSSMVLYWAQNGYLENEHFEDENQSGEYPFALAEVLEEEFSGSGIGDDYTIEFVYQNESTGNTESDYIKEDTYTSDDPGAVTASYMITIHEDQNMTEMDNGTLRDSDEPIHTVDSELPRGDPNSDPIYNVVEVRVTSW
ncbi:DUF7288 family protein [Natrialba swarupiae]|uniref:Uncharacterized protein n=1 Tax=Natrialba swarupiae TaxID=2448032 RepID=A0A5D5AVB2_9EURY|nr:hypothetical protein [Natrialba swarupiae]TYT63051.1 hypothetical protein FYC77_05260 [Natrialba swarupiae]